MLFVLGGNGTHAGANAIHEEVLMSQLTILSSAYSWLNKYSTTPMNLCGIIFSFQHHFCAKQKQLLMHMCA